MLCRGTALHSTQYVELSLAKKSRKRDLQSESRVSRETELSLSTVGPRLPAQRTHHQNPFLRLYL